MVSLTYEILIEPANCVQGWPQIEGGIIVTVGTGRQLKDGAVTTSAASRSRKGKGGRRYGLIVVAALRHSISVGV
jgi:hypothetical protein